MCSVLFLSFSGFEQCIVRSVSASYSGYSGFNLCCIAHGPFLALYRQVAFTFKVSDGFILYISEISGVLYGNLFDIGSRYSSYILCRKHLKYNLAIYIF